MVEVNKEKLQKRMIYFALKGLVMAKAMMNSEAEAVLIMCAEQINAAQ